LKISFFFAGALTGAPMAGAALNDTYKRKEEIEERGLRGSQERRHSSKDDRELDLQ
jgi:hypothetical protein